MAMKKYWFILLAGVVFPLFAGENLRVPDIRALGMGGNGVTLSSVYNPALLEFSPQSMVRLEYFNRYALKELGTVNGSIQYPNRFLSAALYLSSFGYDQYRQNRVRMALAKRLNPHWSVGVAFQYTWIQSELYTRIASKDIEIKELTTYEIQTGFNYEIINNLLITAFVSWNEMHQVRGGFGMEYVAWERFQVRAGVQTGPFLPCLGAGFKWKRFGMDAVALWHPVLGISSGVGLSYLL